MANITTITTRKKLKPELVEEQLETLRTGLFRSALVVDRQIWQGDVVFTMRASSPAVVPGYRAFYLETLHRISVTHNLGGDFYAWVHAVTCNHLARTFNGRVTDEGVDTGPLLIRKNNFSYLTFLKWCYPHALKKGQVDPKTIRFFADQTPPAFQADLRVLLPHSDTKPKGGRNVAKRKAKR